jgi:hypothetical protein
MGKTALSAHERGENWNRKIGKIKKGWIYTLPDLPDLFVISK